MRSALAALALTIAVFAAPSAQAQQAPPECRQNAQGVVNYEACLAASPPGAPWRPLALINLGTQALAREDYAAAVRYYDEAIPPGQTLISDVTYHSNRAFAYSHVGRGAEALVDARLAYRMLRRDPTLPQSSLEYLPSYVNPEMIYVAILPVLKEANAEEFAPAMQAFMELPATDWISYANRSAVLQQVGNTEAALSMSARAIELAPNEPAALNNHCYTLFMLQRAGEALPYCERAVAGAPTIAAARHSLAEVLAALGRCPDSERELATARRLDAASAVYQRPIACAAH